MAAALNLEPGCDNDENLTKEYESLGLRKERYLFSLRIKNSLKAIVMINISDIGLNMSEINNSIKIFILDPEGINRDILYFFLSMMCVKLNVESIPVLVYPQSVAKDFGMPLEKTYNLWILNMLNLDEYFDSCTKILRIN